METGSAPSFDENVILINIRLTIGVVRECLLFTKAEERVRWRVCGVGARGLGEESGKALMINYRLNNLQSIGLSFHSIQGAQTRQSFSSLSRCRSLTRFLTRSLRLSVSAQLELFHFQGKLIDGLKVVRFFPSGA